MSYLQTFQVFPYIPEPLKFLEVLANNLWWCWNLEAIELFRRINPRLWEESGRNPIVFSALVEQKKLDELATDGSFLNHMEEVRAKFIRQVIEPLGKKVQGPNKGKEVIAYFSMEFGIHESLQLSAGGLGILAGDHLKAASDLGLPLVGVGLLYTNGYFYQFLNNDGWQQEEYPKTDLYKLPVESVKDSSGNDLRIAVTGPEGAIQLMVWKIMVGRIPLYLLDTNIKENPPAIREINSRLYHSDSKVRLAQEVILGIGGMRALNAMGINPIVCHLNEGHCSFTNIERLAQIRSRYAVDLQTAMEINARTTIFTTHTPVMAAYDEFPFDQVKPYLVSFEKDLGLSADNLLKWGQMSHDKKENSFSMFVLGLQLSQYHNGVSRLHGSVARRMWSFVWPGIPEEEIPIYHITNGAHIPSWISIENFRLFERYLGRDWSLKPWNTDMSKRIEDIYDEELWRSHEMSRTRLIRSCRKRMVRQYGRRNAPKSVMKEAESVLEDDILTIAFARRFTAYKRSNLLFNDLNRFEAILKSEQYPVQFIFAGKAHPMDNEGKKLIQQIVHLARNPAYRHKIIFLEDYDINIARHLVQGADVWLNTPRRPMEACGTSGMKAAANGVLNVSILDGWWCEGYSTETGWAIGTGEDFTDQYYQDTVESQALYNVLENEVLPSFYNKTNGGIPSRWLSMMKASIRMALELFCAQKMVINYNQYYYTPAMEQYYDLIRDGAARAIRLKNYHERLREKWRDISIEMPVRKDRGPLRVGESLIISTIVHLGKLTPDEVDVELFYGQAKTVESIADGKTQQMKVTQDLGNGIYRYECSLPCQVAGRFGFTARVIPRADSFIKYTPGLITWV
ncbi:MAG: alpha-glucan family phosphorylase [Deltaproteobacteria bacterium]|nr:alpha-glucan family phosphorylase [Deltaproteobacteria bacterium]